MCEYETFVCTMHPEARGAKSPGPGVTDGCELPDVGAEEQRVLLRN